MKKGIYITYKNGVVDIFEETNLDCNKLTPKGHAAKMIDVWSKSSKTVYVLDNYNAVLLDEVICIRVI